MELLKISLFLGDSADSILGLFEKTDAKKILFLLPRNFLPVQETSFLKQLKQLALDYDKEIFFFSSQQFILDILRSQEIKCFSEIPPLWQSVEEKTLEFFFPKKKAEKNIRKNISFLEESIKKKKNISFSSKKIEESPPRKPIRGKIFFAFSCVVLFLLGMLSFISPKATIVLRPKTSLHPVTQNFILSFPDSLIPDQEKSLPKVDAIRVETVLTEKQVFPTSGRRYELTNARGKVTLFNETDKPKPLVPSRLATEDGIVFRFSKEVVIPPKKNGIPGQLVIDIVADEYDLRKQPIGERGNLPAGTNFIFPALPQNLQDKYYARANQGPLVGGSTLTHYLFDAEDPVRAKNLLVSSLRSRGIDILFQENQRRADREKKKYILLNDPKTFTVEVFDEKIPPIPVGTEIQTFEYEASVKVKGIVFDQGALLKLLHDRIRESQDDRKRLIQLDPKTIQYQILSKTSEENFQNWIKLSVEVEGVEMFDFHSSLPSAEEWRYKLRKEIAGKDIKTALSILKNYPEIETILDIQIAPFWKKTMPTILDQIEFKIQGS